MKIAQLKNVLQYAGKDKYLYIVTKGLDHDPMTERRKMIIALIESLPPSSYLKLNCNVTKKGCVQFNSAPKKQKFNSYVVKHSVFTELLARNRVPIDLLIARKDVLLKTIESARGQMQRKIEKISPKTKKPKNWVESTKEELTRKATRYERMVYKRLESAFGNRVKVQHPFVINGKVYYADMCIKSKKIIIEVDGEYHDKEEQKEKDGRRDLDFSSIGYKTIRIPNRYAGNKEFMSRLIETIKEGI